MKTQVTTFFENLAVLCFDCHDEAHIKGGVGRKLTPAVVTKYRDEWLKDVQLRRDLANERAVTRQVGDVSISEQIKAEPRIRVRHTQLKDLPVDYINSLPKFKSDLIRQTNKRKSRGSTLDIVQANNDYEDSLTGILVTLANYYSPECFGDQSPQEFFFRDNIFSFSAAFCSSRTRRSGDWRNHRWNSPGT